MSTRFVGRWTRPSERSRRSCNRCDGNVRRRVDRRGKHRIEGYLCLRLRARNLEDHGVVHGGARTLDAVDSRANPSSAPSRSSSSSHDPPNRNRRATSSTALQRCRPVGVAARCVLEQYGGVGGDGGDRTRHSLGGVRLPQPHATDGTRSGIFVSSAADSLSSLTDQVERRTFRGRVLAEMFIAAREPRTVVLDCTMQRL